MEALAERLGEVIEEYSEANDITPGEVLYALEYVYACVERTILPQTGCTDDHRDRHHD